MIKSTFVCEDCSLDLEYKHSIKEKPEVSCPECGKEMTRAISGGSHGLVKGGKLSGHQTKAEEHKDRADMAHAKKVANYVKSYAQPKTQSAFMNRNSVKGVTQPATPGTRIKKEAE